jgi:hypothetical protein
VEIKIKYNIINVWMGRDSMVDMIVFGGVASGCTGMRTLENFDELAVADAEEVADAAEEDSLPLSYSANRISTTRSPLRDSTAAQIW